MHQIKNAAKAEPKPREKKKEAAFKVEVLPENAQLAGYIVQQCGYCIH